MAYINNHFSRRVKSLQCDNGGKYQNHPFLDYLATHGIIPCFSCLYTSQQNGKAERTLRTHNYSIRSLLFQANMPAPYWTEALEMATHLFNIMSSSSIDQQILYTKLFKKPATYSHLRVFGCLSYPNLFPTTSHKLELRSTVCIFLGYPTHHKGYRCLDLTTRKVIISRHVIFDETIFLFSYNLHSSMWHTYDPFFDIPLSPSILLNTQPQTTIPTAPNQPPKVDPTPLTVTPPRRVAKPPLPAAPYPMITCTKIGNTKPQKPLSLHTDTLSPLPTSHIKALEDPN